MIGYRYRTGRFYAGFCFSTDIKIITCEWCECHYMALANGYHWTWTTGGNSDCGLDFPIGIHF